MVLSTIIKDIKESGYPNNQEVLVVINDGDKIREDYSNLRRGAVRSDKIVFNHPIDEILELISKYPNTGEFIVVEVLRRSDDEFKDIPSYNRPYVITVI